MYMNFWWTKALKKNPEFQANPKDHWTLKTGCFEDPTPAIQVQTLPLEGPRSLGKYIKTKPAQFRFI